MSSSTYFGLADPAAGPMPAWFSPYVDPQLQPVSQNTPLAQQLFAGVANPPTSLALVYPQNQRWAEMASIIQSQVGALGIVVSLQALDADAYADAINGTGVAYDLALGSWAGDRDPDSWTYGLLHGAGAYAGVITGNGQCDGLLDDGRASNDQQQRVPTYQQAQGVAAASPPFVFLTVERHATGMTAAVEAELAVNGNAVPQALLRVAAAGAMLVAEQRIWFQVDKLTDASEDDQRQGRFKVIRCSENLKAVRVYFDVSGGMTLFRIGQNQPASLDGRLTGSGVGEVEGNPARYYVDFAEGATEAEVTLDVYNDALPRGQSRSRSRSSTRTPRTRFLATRSISRWRIWSLLTWKCPRPSPRPRNFNWTRSTAFSTTTNGRRARLRRTN